MLTGDDCYRVLDLPPGASAEEVRRAHRDLTKVWHPDRFGKDPALRKKAEEKLKEINEAYERIRQERPAPRPAPPPPAKPRPPMVSRDVINAIAAAVMAILILLRRPTPAGLVIALALLVIAFVFVSRLRR